MNLKELIGDAFELHPVAGIVVLIVIALVFFFLVLLLSGVFTGISSFGSSLVNHT